MTDEAPRAPDSEVAAVMEAAGAITALNFDQLESANEQVNRDARRLLLQAQAVCQQLTARGVALLPPTQLAACKGALVAFAGKFRVLPSLTPDKAAQFIISIANQYATMYEHLLPVAGFGANYPDDMLGKLLAEGARNTAWRDDTSRDLGEELERQVTARLGATVDQVTALRNDAFTARDAARKAAGDSGIAAHMAKFRDRAKEHKTASRGWLVTAGMLAACWLAAVAYVAFWAPHITVSEGTASVLVALSPRVLLFSFGIAIVFWASRNYRANRHNYVVNVHRQTALETFSAFTEGARGNPDVKNAILLQATQAIFVMTPTGYSGAEKEAAGPQSAIIEVVRALGNADRGAHEKPE